MASTFGNTEIVELLLDAGADVHASNEQSLLWALHYGHDDVIKLLLKYGANPKILDE